jgi:hypothetical protein
MTFEKELYVMKQLNSVRRNYSASPNDSHVLPGKTKSSIRPKLPLHRFRWRCFWPTWVCAPPLTILSGRPHPVIFKCDVKHNVNIEVNGLMIRPTKHIQTKFTKNSIRSMQRLPQLHPLQSRRAATPKIFFSFPRRERGITLLNENEGRI